MSPMVQVGRHLPPARQTLGDWQLQVWEASSVQVCSPTSHTREGCSGQHRILSVPEAGMLLP